MDAVGGRVIAEIEVVAWFGLAGVLSIGLALEFHHLGISV